MEMGDPVGMLCMMVKLTATLHDCKASSNLGSQHRAVCRGSSAARAAADNTPGAVVDGSDA